MDKKTHTLIILHTCGPCNLFGRLLVLWLLAFSFVVFYIEGAYRWHNKHWRVDDNNGFLSSYPVYDLKPMSGQVCLKSVFGI